MTDAVTSVAGTTAAATQTSAFAADKEMFLKLLTTQMQNQDPLNPMDASEYTQQLVQYSQIEQSIQQTGVMQDMLAQLKSQDMLQASSLIGREVNIGGPAAGLGAAPAQWSYAFNSTPATIEATIKDSGGTVIQRLTPDALAAGKISWDGKRADGQTAPAGIYTLSISAADESGTPMIGTIGTIGTVEEVMSTSAGTMLRVNGQLVAMSSISSVGKN